jgi:mannan endo-1,4-beta-mannosidase
MRIWSLIAFGATSLASPGHIVRAEADERDVHIVRDGPRLLLNGKPWKAVGPNIYWLALDENVVPPAGQPFYAKMNASYPDKGRVVEVMRIVKAMGGNMVRAHTLGVSTGNPLSLMPSPGVINKAAFEPIDWAVYQARENNVRLMIPLTDNYVRRSQMEHVGRRANADIERQDYYHGGKYDFLRWAGFNLTQSRDSSNPLIQQFYTNATIIKMFKNYIYELVTHVNPYTGLSYSQDPTIFAYETGNEMLGPFWGDMDCPSSWISEIGKYVKSLAPKKLFVDGTYGINQTHLNIPEVDIFSDHFYPPTVEKLKEGLKLGD